jgi:CRP-like cAMP-binding protein
MNERQYFLVKVIRKIPIFAGFELADIQRILKICQLRDFQAGEHIYATGEPSEEMLVLLKGNLSVTGDSGEEFAKVKPGNPTGEMGVFTGQPRSANIIAGEDSTAIVLDRENLVLALETNKEMHVKVLQNLVTILSTRLAEANGLNQGQAGLIKDLERKLEGDDDDDDEDDDDDDEDDDDEED